MDVRAVADSSIPQSQQPSTVVQQNTNSLSGSSSNFINTLVDQLAMLSAAGGSGTGTNPMLTNELTQLLSHSGSSTSSSGSSSALSVPTAEFLVMTMMQNLQMPGMDSGTDSGTTDSIGGLDSSSLDGMSGLESIMTALTNPTFTSPLTTSTDVANAYTTGASTGTMIAGVNLNAQNRGLGDLSPLNVSEQGPTDQVITQAIAAASQKYGVPESLVRGVIQQESGGNPYSQSGAGAQGLMQLMPDTARGLGVSDSFDPVQNIDGGTKYLAGLLKQFNGNESLALAAYNAGPAAVLSHGGIPPYPETQAYVQNVLAYVAQYA